MNNKLILVTGADGFVGRHLCAQLFARGFKVKGTVCPEFKCGEVYEGVEEVQIESIGPYTNWSLALKGVDIVVHLAARVHVMKDDVTNPLSEYRRVNTFGTEQLVKAALSSGVKRFVYISTVKVNGEGSELAYTENDKPQPEDPYAVSKFEVEQFLKDIATKTGLEIVIIRPSLVYGPGVKANFLRLIKMVSKRIPLPFGSIKNSRSFIYVDNLADAIVACAVHPKASGETFLVSDNQNISTPDLIKMLALHFGVKPRLLSFPPNIFKVVGNLLGKKEEVARIIGSLYINNWKIRKTLNWEPPYTLEQGMKKTVEWYKSI